MSRSIPAGLGVLVLMGSLGCGPPQTDQRAKVPAAPDPSEGRQFVMPEAVIPRHSERMICWIPDWVPDQGYSVTRLEPIQGSLGHHLLAMVSGTPRKAGTTFDCTDPANMASMNPLVIPDPPGRTVLPEGFAVPLPQGALIIFQSHYINTTDRDLLVADVARFHFAAPGTNPTLASYLVVNSTQLDLAPNGPGSITVNCQVPQELHLLALLGHMHGMGTRVTVQRQHAGAQEILYDVPNWSVELRDRPPINFYSPDKPLVLDPTEPLTLTCQYNNPTGDRVRFPSEMCDTVGYYFPALPEGMILCDQ